MMTNPFSDDQVTRMAKTTSISNNTHHIKTSIAVKQDKTKMLFFGVPPG